jgi:hypothetical protein
MVFNATFNNISVILWWSVLLVEQTVITRRKPPSIIRMSIDCYYFIFCHNELISSFRSLQKTKHNFFFIQDSQQ